MRLDALPTIRTSRDAESIFAALDKLSLKGKLPGYEQIDERRFKVALFGDPFDRDLIATITPDERGGSVLTFNTKLHAKAPILLIVSIVVSIWPGVVLMDSLIPASWGWWPTWWWYLPLVIVPLPIFLPRIWKKSERSAADHLREQVVRIQTICEGATSTA